MLLDSACGWASPVTARAKVNRMDFNVVSYLGSELLWYRPKAKMISSWQVMTKQGICKEQ
jgi:hypothetical protein